MDPSTSETQSPSRSNAEVNVLRHSDFAHHLAPPTTPEPPPADISPSPLRYPDTLGTLVEVRETEENGLGLFACQDILPGTILLCEAPLVTLTDTGSRVDPLDSAINALTPEQRASFHSLHGFSSNKHESRNRSIVYSNGYSIAADLSTGVFITASRINHSCIPNSLYIYKPTLNRMLFWNRFKLLKGEEITVDYGHKRGWLKRIYGFECMCGGCTDSETSNGLSGKSSGSGQVEEGEVGTGKRLMNIDELLKIR